MVKKIIYEKKCAVSFQTNEKPKFIIPLEGGIEKGIEWVSYPLGYIKLFQDSIELKAVKKILIKNKEVISFEKKKIFFGILGAVIIINHKNKNLPRHIWIAGIFSGILYNELKDIIRKNKIKINFK